MMGGSKRQYFWNVAGFVSLIVCMESVPQTDGAFELALLRILETGLGILVYSLVTVLVWPSSTREELDAAVRRLVGTQHMLYCRYRELLHSQGNAEGSHPLRMQEVQQFNQLAQALAVTRTRLQRLDALTRALFDLLADIKGYEMGSPQPLDDMPPQPRFAVDPDRMTAAARVVAGLWLAYLVWLYTEIPGGTAFVVMAGPIGMALANMPQMPVSVLFVPAAVSVAFASILYVFIMPQLSSFAGLGFMIFAVTFAICYLFYTPKQGLGRALGLAMFVTIAGISNQQSYSFLSVANTALMCPLVFGILAVTSAQAEQIKAAADFERASQLVQKGDISKRGFDQAKASRMPVRVHLEQVPDVVQLRVGTTASVLVMTGTSDGDSRGSPVPAPAALQ